MGDVAVTTPSNIGAPDIAYDDDKEHYYDLIHTLFGVDSLVFTIDRGTGQIRTKVGERYDRETKASYMVGVSRRRTSSAPIPPTDYTITVLDAAEPPLAPAAPVVTATAGSLTSLDVSWSAPSNTGRPAIESYELTC